MTDPAYAYWCGRIGESPVLHRKQWEFCFILQAAATGGVMAPGFRALGFGVGLEPLPAALAVSGVQVTATDLAPDRPEAQLWAGSSQHAAVVTDLNARNLCPPDRFAALVSHQWCDMNAIAPELKDFDFCWSSCALEHLGDIEHGLDFIENSLETLRPGGLAVHTTELNCSPGEETVTEGQTVIFRQSHLQALARRLRRRGHHVELDFSLGDQPPDLHVDLPPYTQDIHLKLQLGGYVSTSYGIVVRKRSAKRRVGPRWRAWP